MSDTEIAILGEKVEKVIVKLDSQILNSIDLCAERYRLEHVLNRRPIKKGEALQHGGVMHTMLKHYYRGKMMGRAVPGQHNILIDEAILLGRQEASAMTFDLTEFENDDLRTFKENILHHQYDGWEILNVEEPFTKVLYDSDDLQILYEGIIDLHIRDPRNGEAVVDHKTESRRSNPFALSNQFQGYSWAFGSNVVINKVGYQTSVDAKDKFRRLWHTHDPILLEEWRQDAIRSVRRAVEWHRNNYFPRNRTSCDKYSGCIFQMVCKAAPEVREYKLQAYYIQDKPWDPYTRDDE